MAKWEDFRSLAGDFHLTDASVLAIDQGADLSGVVDDDFQGLSRPKELIFANDVSIIVNDTRDPLQK